MLCVVLGRECVIQVSFDSWSYVLLERLAPFALSVVTQCTVVTCGLVVGVGVLRSVSNVRYSI